MTCLKQKRKSRAGFVLLEVILSIIILGIAVSAFLRSFTVSLAAAKKAQIVTTACLLCQQVIEEYEVIPPQDDHSEGTFGTSSDELYLGSDYKNKGTTTFENYYWVVDVEDVEVEYPDITFESSDEEYDMLTKITVSIIYDDGRLKRFTPVTVETYLTNTEKFTYASKKENKLY